MMQNKILQNRKGPAPGDKKCYALNTSGGYISDAKTYPEYSSLWHAVSTCTESSWFGMIGLFLLVLSRFSYCDGYIIICEEV